MQYLLVEMGYTISQRLLFFLLNKSKLGSCPILEGTITKLLNKLCQEFVQGGYTTYLQ